MINRSREADVLDLAAAAGPYDELPLLLPDLDPQLTLSRNDRRQPFFLVCDHDTVLVQFGGTAYVEFENSNARREFLEFGDFLYVPAGTPHRIDPVEPSIHLRFRAATAVAEAVAWFCDQCGAPLRRAEWSAIDVAPQEAYADACNWFSSDDQVRKCRCGQVSPPIDLTGYRWGEIAEELRAQDESSHPELRAIDPDERSGAIPTPDHRRTVRVSNVFTLLQTANTLLMPLFPYVGEGAMVPALNHMVTPYRGGAAVPLGRFYHLNSVDEVFLMFNPKPGFVRVGGRMHKVEDPYGDDPEATGCRISVVTQRHRVGEEQSEACLLRCSQCRHQLMRHDYTFAPSEADAERSVQEFATIPAHAAAMEHFNSDIALRTCDKCGHVNDEFPVSNWGWQDYARQTQTARAALYGAREIVEATLTADALSG